MTYIPYWLKDWSGRIVFIITSILIPILFDSKQISNPIKIGSVIILIGLYIIGEVVKSKAIKDEQIITSMLARVEELKFIDVTQRLRANIFKIVKRGYRLECSYNMRDHKDKDLFIPENMGITGQVFRTGVQQIGNKQQVFPPNSEYKIPEEMIGKVPPDMEWICSTPITNKKGKVIYVLNFDGNKPSDGKFPDIMKLGNKLAEELKHCLDI
jgi:hypothetical protein